MTTKIKLIGLHKSFGDKEILSDINLSIATGELVTIIGPSGSGKSTLIRCLNLLEVPSSGQLAFNNELVDFQVNSKGRLTHRSEASLPKFRTKIGMVFQHFNLFANRTVLQNLTDAPKRILKQPAKIAYQDAQHFLELVGLLDFQNQYPSQLSGGQQQRVAIARALMMHPEVLLFDEPTSALDPEMVNEVLTVMLRLKAAGITMVVVTHEMAFTQQASDRVVFIEHGRIQFLGSPTQLANQADDSRVKEFINKLDHRIVLHALEQKGSNHEMAQ
ncbi:MAG: amino acid ABC transporter ATP-binding protein [Lactobacillus sp.]|jgi:ABC-type polar amino acid transport system ATPase subunit|nr:amino acid ABC transporter ATP-binding protein [Lactobacillus sp.]